MLLRDENSGFPRFTRNFWDEKSAAKRPRNWGGPRVYCIMGARKMGGGLYIELKYNIEGRFIKAKIIMPGPRTFFRFFRVRVRPLGLGYTPLGLGYTPLGLGYTPLGLGYAPLRLELGFWLG